jgi:hypothetical protein
MGVVGTVVDMVVGTDMGVMGADMEGTVATGMVSGVVGVVGGGAGRTMATVTVTAGRTMATPVTMRRCPMMTKVFRTGDRPGLSCTVTVAGSTISWDRISSRWRHPVSVITAVKIRG